MGLLTDFFVASEQELRAAFPNRYPVAARPKIKKAKNPFTGEPITVREWGPAKPFPKKPAPLSPTDEARAVRRLPCASFTKVDTVKLVKLYCLITGDEYTDVVGDFGRPALVTANDEDHTWVERLPAKWVAAVAGVENVAALAKKWARTEECRLDRFTVQDTTEVLSALRDLARQARAADMDMFLWTTL